MILAASGLIAVLLTGGLMALYNNAPMTQSPADKQFKNSRNVSSKTTVKGKTTAKTTEKPKTVATASRPTAAPLATVNQAVTAPLATTIPLYANPAGSLSKQATAWATAHPADASAMLRLASQPVAEWFGGWNGNVQADADAYVSAATAVGKLPVLVAYNIPDRDCGSYSAGGASDASAYRNWIQSLANGIGQRRAIVVLEPDALASGCYTAARAAMLAAAVQTFAVSTRASVYLDAGNPTWQSTATMTVRLQSAGIAQATGFSLNVSNFQTTGTNLTYGSQLSKSVGGKHFVVDTSRNGNGPAPDGQWCNPSGRALGASPTLATGQTLADAFLWIKLPGESDGQCGVQVSGTSAPAAGTWWPEYTVDLLRNSGWQ